MSDKENNETSRESSKRLRIAVMPYLCVRPLLDGLDSNRQIDIVRSAPSGMKNRLAGGELDAALLPTIELQRFGRSLTVIPAGCIASAGESLVVRIFSRVRPEHLHILWCDMESCSATALAQTIWGVNYRRRLHVIPYDPQRSEPPADAQAALIVGDKVVTNPPFGFDWQFDLSAMWFEITGLPFVFAVWAADAERCGDMQGLWQILNEARVNGRQNLDRILHDYAPSYGWPMDLAERHLLQQVQTDFTEAHRQGLTEFFDLAEKCGIIESVMPVKFFTPSKLSTNTR